MDGIIGKCKTETSRRPVPIDQFTAKTLSAWREETCYAQTRRLGTSSARGVQGKMPPWTDAARSLPSTDGKAGRNHQAVGLHTLRQTYSTRLKANGENIPIDEIGDTSKGGLIDGLYAGAWIRPESEPSFKTRIGMLFSIRVHGSLPSQRSTARLCTRRSREAEERYGCSLVYLSLFVSTNRARQDSPCQLRLHPTLDRLSSECPRC